MADYREFSDVPNLRVEVEPNGSTGGPGHSLSGLLQAIGSIVAGATQQLGQLPAEQRPTDLRISFGIRALEDGRFAVALGGDANFEVTLAWTQEAGPGIPELPAPELPPGPR
jgi:hypothetical protein